MDGHFVPNLTLGHQLVAAIRRQTRLPIDVHLMVENPRSFVPLFHEAGADWISLHVEATAHLHKDLTLIRGLGRKAGAALNPATPIDTLKEILSDLDYVLIMSVNPGWGGQSFIPSCRDKIRRLRDWIRSENLRVPIEVDGGIKLDNVEDIIEAGMEIVVFEKLKFDNDIKRLTVTGGLANSGVFFKNGLYFAIRAQVADIQIHEPILPPVLGAVLLALEMIDPRPSADFFPALMQGGKI